MDFEICSIFSSITVILVQIRMYWLWAGTNVRTTNRKQKTENKKTENVQWGVTYSNVRTYGTAQRHVMSSGLSLAHLSYLSLICLFNVYCQPY